MKFLQRLGGALLAATGASLAYADGVVFLAGDVAQDASGSLRRFIESDWSGMEAPRTALLIADGNGHFEGIESLAEADLLVTMIDLQSLPASDEQALLEYIDSGRPLVLLRNSVGALPELPRFHRGVTAANNLGLWDSRAPLQLAPGNPQAIEAWGGAFATDFQSTGPLRRVTPLAETALPLLWGKLVSSDSEEKSPDAEPVVWTSGYTGARIFVTTLGSPRDFSQASFRSLVSRGMQWAMEGHDQRRLAAAPVLTESDSVSIFDGESLEGWTTRGGRYDGNARWTVEEGVIVGRQGPGQAGGLLYTNRPYKNFILSFETQIDYPFDSGVFLHMVPRGGGKGIQVTLDYRPDGQIGGIYADGYLKQNPDSTDLLERDTWNQVVVRCVGDDMHVTSWLNGKLLMDYETPAGTEGFAPEGLIGIQVHGGEHVPDTQRAMFRNLRLRELPDFDAENFEVDDRGILSTTRRGEAAGWKPIFNGRDLSGWDPRPNAEAYVVQDGVMTLPVAGGDGEIRTLGLYRNFELRLDFKISRMANSGLFLRSGPLGNPSFSGCEVQIIDDFNWETVTQSTLKPYQFSGGLYGAQPPAVRDALRPLGEWNTYFVRYVDSRIAVHLNDRLLYDVDTFELEAKPPFVERVAQGFIGMQRHAPPGATGEAFAWFRNLFLREVESDSTSTSSGSRSQ